MDPRLQSRLRDIEDAIFQLETLFGQLDFPAFVEDRIGRAACERFLEIISEASRHIPPDRKERWPAIPWRQIADMGNHLRHAYQRIDPEILWQIYSSGQLDALKAAVNQIAANRSAETDD